MVRSQDKSPGAGRCIGTGRARCKHACSVHGITTCQAAGASKFPASEPLWKLQVSAKGVELLAVGPWRRGLPAAVAQWQSQSAYLSGMHVQGILCGGGAAAPPVPLQAHRGVHAAQSDPAGVPGL